MIIKRICLVCGISIAMVSLASLAESTKSLPDNGALLTAHLEGVPNTEVILSSATLPPNTELAKHWHPGEEFIYIIEGSVSVWLGSEPEKVVTAGEAIKIPLKKVHRAMVREQGATFVVFRVHEQGQPERILVE